MPLSQPTSSDLTIPKLNDTLINISGFSGALAAQPDSATITLVNNIVSVTSTSGVFVKDTPQNLLINKSGLFILNWDVKISFNITATDAADTIDSLIISYGTKSRIFKPDIIANNYTKSEKTYSHVQNFNSSIPTVIIGDFPRIQVSVNVNGGGVNTWDGNLFVSVNNFIAPSFLYKA